MTASLEDTVAAHMSVANTPLFLVRKLRSENIIKSLAHQSDRSLMAGLRNSLSQNDSSFAKKAMPYAYLIAIFEKKKTNLLAEARNYPHDNFEWYDNILDFLEAKFPPRVENIVIEPNIKVSATKIKIQMERFS